MWLTRFFREVSGSGTSARLSAGCHMLGARLTSRDCSHPLPSRSSLPLLQHDTRRQCRLRFRAATQTRLLLSPPPAADDARGGAGAHQRAGSGVAGGCGGGARAVQVRSSLDAAVLGRLSCGCRLLRVALLPLPLPLLLPLPPVPSGYAYCLFLEGHQRSGRLLILSHHVAFGLLYFANRVCVCFGFLATGTPSTRRGC